MKKSLIATCVMLFIAGIAVGQSGKTVRKPVSKTPGLITEIGIPAVKSHKTTAAKPQKSNYAEYEEVAVKGKTKTKAKPKH